MFQAKIFVTAGLALIISLFALLACAASANSDASKVGIGTDSTQEVKLSGGAGDPIAGKGKSELCQGCHGEDGNSPDSMTPKLAGQNASYIIKQLRNYQIGVRSHPIMSAVAAAVIEEDLDDIGAYFSSRTKMQGNGSVNKIGKDLYHRGDMSRMIVACVNCHGVIGEGKASANSIFPVIGGQHKDYLLGQLVNFKAGDRSNSPGGVMNIMVQRMTADELEALADYVAGL